MGDIIKIKQALKELQNKYGITPQEVSRLLKMLRKNNQLEIT